MPESCAKVVRRPFARIVELRKPTGCRSNCPWPRTISKGLSFTRVCKEARPLAVDKSVSDSAWRVRRAAEVEAGLARLGRCSTSAAPVKRPTLPPPPFVANPQRRDLLLLDCGYSVPVYPDVIEPKPARPPTSVFLRIFATIVAQICRVKCTHLCVTCLWKHSL